MDPTRGHELRGVGWPPDDEVPLATGTALELQTVASYWATVATGGVMLTRADLNIPP